MCTAYVCVYVTIVHGVRTGDALWGCFRRKGRQYRQCRPNSFPCDDGPDWLCPRLVAPPPPARSPLPAHLAAATRFADGLGPGVNVMATALRWGQLNDADFAGLAHRVGHVRLCGDILQSVVDWRYCPGRNWQPEAGATAMSEEQIQAQFHSRLVSDPAFDLYRTAARTMLRHGLKLVLNPLHKKWATTLDAPLLRRVWKVLLAEFRIEDFPIERVAFEAVNEPGVHMIALHPLAHHLHMHTFLGARPGKRFCVRAVCTHCEPACACTSIVYSTASPLAQCGGPHAVLPAPCAPLSLVCDGASIIPPVELSMDAFTCLWRSTGNWNTWRVHDRVADLLVDWARLVGHTQPGRVVVLPTEIGFLRCGPDGPESRFMQSWESLLSGHAGNGAASLRRFIDDVRIPVIGTFHFYDPRTFTHARGTALRAWDVRRGAARIEAIFSLVRAAVPSVPFYVGEFGLDVDGSQDQSSGGNRSSDSDGAAWLRAVRTFADERGFAYALWTYYLSKQGVVSARDARDRLREWDCSALVGAVFNFSSVGRVSACGGLMPFTPSDGDDSSTGDASGDERGSTHAENAQSAGDRDGARGDDTSGERVCTNVTSIWMGSWGHSAGSDLSSFSFTAAPVIGRNVSVLVHNSARSWSPARGVVFLGSRGRGDSHSSGDSSARVVVDFGGEWPSTRAATTIEGELRLGDRTAGGGAAGAIIEWTTGATWLRRSPSPLCQSVTAPHDLQRRAAPREAAPPARPAARDRCSDGRPDFVPNALYHVDDASVQLPPCAPAPPPFTVPPEPAASTPDAPRSSPSLPNMLTRPPIFDTPRAPVIAPPIRPRVEMSSAASVSTDAPVRTQPVVAFAAAIVAAIAVVVAVTCVVLAVRWRLPLRQRSEQHVSAQATPTCVRRRPPTSTLLTVRRELRHKRLEEGLELEESVSNANDGARAHASASASAPGTSTTVTSAAASGSAIESPPAVA